MLTKNIVKHLNKLQLKKYRKEFNEFIVEGIKGVSEALESEAEILLVVVEGNRRDEPELRKLITLAEDKKVTVSFCGRNDVDIIKSTETFPGVLAVIGQFTHELDEMIPGHIICLDRVQDPGNLGTIIRTVDWFGKNSGIILSEESVDLFNPKTVRGTMGSIFRVPVLTSRKLADTLAMLKKNNEYQIISLELESDDISQMKIDKPTIFIFGNESHGMSPQLAELVDKRYTIPGKGGAESLNLAIAAGILISRI